jgi:hypothetical protein
MSLLPSSNAVRALLLCAVAAAGGCSQSTNATATATAGHGVGAVGYVRMGDLVKVHPLYPELTRLDDDMAALQLKSVGGAAAVSPADLAREQKAMQAELDRATERAKAALKEKQDEYGKREQAAIRQALAAAGGAAGAGGGAAIASDAERKLQQQAQSVSQQATKNYDLYRRSVLAQNQAALVALQRSLNEKAARTYRTQAEALQKKEADYALQLANETSAERLSLRVKLSNLVLDDAARADARKQMDALDRKQADDMAAMKNRDAASLAALQTTLRDQSKAELDARAAAINAATTAKLAAREKETRQEVVAKLGGMAQTQTVTQTAAAPALPPDMRAKLEALHKKYQDDFNKDAKATLDDFAKTRAGLAERFQKLQGVDAAAQAGSDKQLAALQHQREQLYDQMVAQIGREVKLIAAKRGIDVVFSDVVAPAGGVDLTADAEKDIESLHE